MSTTDRRNRWLHGRIWLSRVTLLIKMIGKGGEIHPNRIEFTLVGSPCRLDKDHPHATGPCSGTACGTERHCHPHGNFGSDGMALARGWEGTAQRAGRGL